MVDREPCPNVEINSEDCTCTYAQCNRKGKCCECLRHHLDRRELPGCVFPPVIEKTYDRSFKKFASIYTN